MENKPLLDKPRRALSTVDHERLVFLTDSYRVYDAANGRLELYSGPYGIHFGSAQSNTTIDGDLVYQASRDGLLALSLTTGNVQFARYFSHGYSSVSPCYPIIENDRLYQCFYNYSGSDLYCIDKHTGDIIWQTGSNLGGYADNFFPTTDHTSQNIIVAGIDGPACFSKATGRLIWDNRSSAGYARLSPYPKVCADQRVLFYSSPNRALHTFDAGDGSLLWSTDLDPLGIDHIRNPHYHDDSIYLTCEYGGSARNDTTIMAFDIRTGLLVNQYIYPCAIRPAGFHDRYFYVFESPAFLRSTTRLTKHLLGDGTTLWSKTLTGQLGQDIVTTPQFIYCTSSEILQEHGARTINVLDQETGDLLRQYPVHTENNYSPVVVDTRGKAWYPHF
ncbi:MAG: PQQ-binding-like beta-propeller repeat protein [Bacteroidetes bacterium]|nr:PQQ-binding-like beta-propeller repeat protein [Bacteroidota bacterium]